ncbi:hypothetical protein [Sphaerisporangium rubeum]|uniref:Uncharacterized protein n=1 Tax=Sphaerisporangium rubeum TaxID=321317 RepID=A0A7X0IEL4_9ACTN|nr:hypothetical protein [Sphaerisporangium rubeum]MBB6473731.1 hypothetical protein [Sphaerisporangium rubeum]
MALAFGLAGCGGVGPGRLTPVQLDSVRAQGVAPEMVFEVDAPGFRLVGPSVSVYHEDGFQAFYLSPRGGQVWFAVDRGAFSDGICPERPVHGAERVSAPVVCERDDVGWYRVSGDRHEYAVDVDGRVLRVGGVRGEVGRRALRAAATGAHAVGAGAQVSDGR